MGLISAYTNLIVWSFFLISNRKESSGVQQKLPHMLQLKYACFNHLT